MLATRLVPPERLRANLAAMLAGGCWLLAARLVPLVGSAWLGLPGPFRSPAPGLAFALTATGVLTVLLVAVAVTLPRVRSGGERPRSDGVADGD